MIRCTVSTTPGTGRRQTAAIVSTTTAQAALEAATAAGSSGSIGQGVLLPRWIRDEAQHIAQGKTRGLRLFLLADDLRVVV